MTVDPLQSAATREAIVAILQMAPVSDGRIDPREDEAFLLAVRRSRTLGRLSEKDLRPLEAHVASGLAETSLANAVAHIPEDLRLPLFAQALDLLLADGELNESEADFVNGLILHLNIDRKDAEPILEVLALKNRL